jgi:Flp pilus assembly pilin Flp
MQTETRKPFELTQFVKERGRSLVEYALLTSVFLALAAITVLPVLGDVLNSVFGWSFSLKTTGS